MKKEKLDNNDYVSYVLFTKISLQRICSLYLLFNRHSTNISLLYIMYHINELRIEMTIFVFV